MSIVFSFSWGHFNSQEKLKTMLMQNFGVTNKEHYGMLWYFLEWSIVFSLNVRQSLAWRPSLLPAAMTIVVILASSRSFSPPGSLLPISYPCLGRLGVRAPSENILLLYRNCHDIKTFLQKKLEAIFQPVLECIILRRISGLPLLIVLISMLIASTQDGGIHGYVHGDL